MLLAQNPTQWGTTGVQIGEWLLCLATIFAILFMALGSVNQWKRLTFKKVSRPDGERAIKRVEFETFKSTFITRMDALCAQVGQIEVQRARQREETREMIEQTTKPIKDKLDKMQHTLAHVAAKLKVESSDGD